MVESNISQFALISEVLFLFAWSVQVNMIVLLVFDLRLEILKGIE